MAGRAPFRADHVGSLLRPKSLLEMRERGAAGSASAAEVKAAEDEAIGDVVAKQEKVGLQSITDGEFRRDNWALDFFAAMQGTKVKELVLSTSGVGDRRVPAAVVTDKVGTEGHPMLEHIRYLLSQTSRTAKLTIPSPTMIVTASRDWRQAVDASAYDGLEEFFADLGAAYASFVRQAYDVGCRYLQFDDVNLAYLCDNQMREKIAARGDDPDELMSKWFGVINAGLAARPDGMQITTHICRGNYRSQWFAQGGYDPIAERLFNELDYDGFFLEYDSERSGTFEPLRHLPKGNKRVVLGLVTTKTGELETRDQLRAGIEEAAKYAPLDQLCISPQCGFASTHEGNALSQDEQWEKLGLVVDLASEVWADF